MDTKFVDRSVFEIFFGRPPLVANAYYIRARAVAIRQWLRQRLCFDAIGKEAQSQILDLVEDAIILHRLTDVHYPHGIPTGMSKLGGVPDVPPNFQWPTWKGRNQSFVAQINLNDIAALRASPLPQSGMLYFFYDSRKSTSGSNAGDKGSWRVIHYDGNLSKLLPRRRVKRSSCDHYSFSPGLLGFTLAITLPAVTEPCIERLAMYDIELERYDGLQETWDDDSQRARPDHRMLGWPNGLHHWYPPLDCGGAASPGADDQPKDEDGNEPEGPGRADSDWRLLLHVDRDEQLEMQWQDFCDSSLCFWIRQRDLKEHNFGEVWMRRS